MLALIAAQEAASIASGHGSPLTAPIGTGTVDGFAAGMLLSGVVFLLILAQRRALRRPASAGAATRATATTAGPPASAASTGSAHAESHAESAHAGSAHAGPAMAQDSALGMYPTPAPVLAAPVLAAPVEADPLAPLANPPTPLADPLAPLAGPPAPLAGPPAPFGDLPAPLTDPFLTASSEVPEAGEQIGPALSTHPYADVSPLAGASAPARYMPFADAANEVVLQPGVRLEEWLEGEMRRPSLPKRTPANAAVPASASLFEATPAPVATTFTTTAPAMTAPAMTMPVTAEPVTADPTNTVLAANVPAAVAAAEAPTAVVPVTPAAPPATATSSDNSDNSADPDLADESGHHRRSPAYQSKHRLVGRNDSKPWPDNHRRGARHAAASPARSGTRSRMFGLRQLRPVSAGD